MTPIISMVSVSLAVTNYRIDSMVMIITFDDSELIVSALKFTRNIKVAEKFICDCEGASLTDITMQLINEFIARMTLHAPASLYLFC